jgi:LasA protease
LKINFFPSLGVACLFLLLLSCRPAAPTTGPGSASSIDLGKTLEALSTTISSATEAFPAAQTPTPGVEMTVTPVFTESMPPTSLPTALPPQPVETLAAPQGFVLYLTRPGDTLEGLAGRFGVRLEEISYQQPYSAQAYLPGGLQLVFPEPNEAMTDPDLLLPDSELVYSPSAVGFDVEAFVGNAGGFLASYSEEINSEGFSGAAIVQRVANELSINPKLLLAILEYRAGWVYGSPANLEQVKYPFGFYITDQEGLYDELRIAGTQMNLGYYGWKEGRFTLIRFPDESALRLNPFLNAASAGLHNLFAMLYSQAAWKQALSEGEGFQSLYQSMFGDPWERAAAVEPLIPQDLVQPEMELPFPPGEDWSFTSGPHWAWNYGTARGALDFAPANAEGRCEVSKQWATASAAGVIARAANNTVVIDLDGDGYEQTGWTLVYLHLAADGLVGQGQAVNVNDPLGHPSCEGGKATGSHVHLARKFNEEWLSAEAPAPFTLSGYQVRWGGTSYQGELVKDGVSITACPYGCREALIRH